MNAFFKKLFRVFIVAAATVLMGFTVPAEASRRGPPVYDSGGRLLGYKIDPSDPPSHFPFKWQKGYSKGIHGLRKGEGISQGDLYLFVDKKTGRFWGSTYHRTNGEVCFRKYEAPEEYAGIILYADADEAADDEFYAYTPEGQGSILPINLVLQPTGGKYWNVIATASVGPGTDGGKDPEIKGILEEDILWKVTKAEYEAGKRKMEAQTCEVLAQSFDWAQAVLLANPMMSAQSSGMRAQSTQEKAPLRPYWPGFWFGRTQESATDQ